MELEIIGKNGLEITEALKNFVGDKMNTIKRHVSFVKKSHVVLSVDQSKHKHTVEITAHLAGNGKKNIHVTGHDDKDMYAAIILVIDKLDRHVCEHKEHVKDHNH